MFIKFLSPTPVVALISYKCYRTHFWHPFIASYQISIQVYGIQNRMNQSWSMFWLYFIHINLRQWTPSLFHPWISKVGLKLARRLKFSYCKRRDKRESSIKMFKMLFSSPATITYVAIAAFPTPDPRRRPWLPATSAGRGWGTWTPMRWPGTLSRY